MAATVVDALIVSLSLDSSAFTKGSKDAEAAFTKTKGAAQKAGKDIEESGKHGADSLNKLAHQALALFAIFTAGKGIKEFVADITASNAATGRLAKVLDISVSKLSEWQGMARATGGSAEGMTATIASLENSLQQLSLTGESASLPYLRALGIAIQNNNGKFKTADDLLTDLANNPALKAMYADDPGRANALLRGLGLDQTTASIIERGPEALAKLRADQERWGKATDEQTKAAEGLQYRLAGLEQSSGTLGRLIVTKLTPAFDRLLDSVTDFLVWLQAHPDILNVITFGITALAAALALPAIGLGLTAMAAGFAAIVAAMPFVWIAAALALFAAAAHTAFEGGSAPIIANKLGLTPNTAGGFGLDDMGNPLSYSDKNGRIYMPSDVAKMGDASSGLGSSPFGNLIARGEGDYNTVNLGQSGGYQDSKLDLAGKTVGDVMADQAAHRYNAAGRYQITGDTMRGAAAALHLTGTEKFDASLQDRIFEQYLAGSKRPEIRDYLNGTSNDLHAAQLAAAQEWASVASPDTGQSYYAGVANNRSSISSTEMASALLRTRGQRTAGGGLLNAVGNAIIPAASAASALPTGAGAAASVTNSGSSSTSSTTNTTSVGQVHVNTQATDAAGIANDISRELQRAAQLNYGMM